VARERVEDKNRESDAGEPEAGAGEEAAAEPEAGTGKAAGKTAGAKPKSGKPDGRSGADSGTGAAAARTRAVMQRRHLRLGFGMSAAVGVEVAGAAGLVLAGLLPWEWGERLWGRTDTGGLVLQVAIAVTVLVLLLGWWPAGSARADRLRPRTRIAALLPAAVVAVGAVTTVWQAPTGGRGAGGVVAALAAVLVLGGAVGWLVGLRKLRVLFPFGLPDARARGFGNLPAVRRAILVGGPAGAVGGVVVVAGALLIAPGLVTTEDSQTAGAMALAGDPPATGDGPAWDLAVAGGDSATTHATPGGLLVDERRGVRGIDPRDGSDRWHWRDEAYQRVASVVTGSGGTVVLALRYDGDESGRDRVVALDTATGAVRWDRFDRDLVESMSLVAVAPEEGDWFVVPEQQPAPEGQQPPVTLRAVDSDGDTRWRTGESEGCNLSSVSGDANSVLVIGQQCSDPETGTGDCRVTGLDPATGEPAWSWPAERPADADPVAGCQSTPRPGMVFISHQAGSEPAAVALDPDTGAELWSLTGDGVTDLNSPVVAGDAVLGVRPGDGTGGAVLVVRNAADGQVREEIELPAGQPVGIVPVRDGFAAVSHYRPESAEIVLLEVDLAAAAISSETVVTASPEGAAFQRVSVAVGPETLVLDALLAAGGEPGAEDLTLQVHGF
jgi:outer membrane protein assembly factor BamB